MNDIDVSEQTGDESYDEFATVAKYYIVAVRPMGAQVVPAEQVQQCTYWKYVPRNPNPFEEVGSHDIYAQTGAGIEDYVCLVHIKRNVPPKIIEMLRDRPDHLEPEPDISLLGAIARTEDRPFNRSYLSDTYAASVTSDGRNPIVFIPVTPKSTRGVILVFAKCDAKGIVQHVRGSFDPEIKGSTN